MIEVHLAFALSLPIACRSHRHLQAPFGIHHCADHMCATMQSHLLHRNAWQKRQRSGCSRIYFPCPSFVPWHSGQHGQPLALPSGPKSMGTRRSRSCACTPSMLILFLRHTLSRSMTRILSWHHVVFRPCGRDCGVADRFDISISPSPLALFFC